MSHRVLDNKLISLGPFHEIYIDGPAIRDSVEYGWKDMTADLSAVSGQGANPPTWAQFRNGIYGWSFSNAVEDELWVVFHPNHDVIEGEKFYPHVHWSPDTTDTGVVRWGIEYTIAKGFDQEAFPASSTFYMNHEIATNSQYRHIITECSDAQAIEMPEVDSLILMRLFRDSTDVADTFGAFVHAWTIDIHYRAGKFATKGKRPDFNLPD